MVTKDTNPKDAVGIAKVPMSTVSGPVILEIGLAMMEGALKYGRHNYRVAGIRYSVYYDALMRHILAWWEGEDIDPASGVSHVVKALATLVVLRDAMIQQKATDDRPPRSPVGFVENCNKVAAELLAKYPTPVPAYTAEATAKKEPEIRWCHDIDEKQGFCELPTACPECHLKCSTTGCLNPWHRVMGEK
jgi:hypothetical protein